MLPIQLSSIEANQFYQFILMKNTHSQQICHKILNAIIQNSKQKIADNQTIQKYSSAFTNQKYVKVSTNLIKQCGLKSQGLKDRKYHTIDDPKPSNIKKDEYMTKSVRNITISHDKKNKISPKSKRRRTTIFNKPQQSIITTSVNTKQPSLMSNMRNVFFNSKDSSVKKTIQKLDWNQNSSELPANDSFLDDQEENYRDFLREEVIRREQDQFLTIQKQKIEQQTIRQTTQRKKKMFKNGVSSSKTNYTFDLNGKPIIFSTNLQRNALQKKYPYCMKYKTSQSAYFTKSIKNHKNPNPQFVTTRNKKSSLGNISAENISEEENSQLNSMDKSNVTISKAQRKQEKKNIYNNNNQRQQSNRNFFKPQQGTFYKQPHTSTTIRGQRDMSKVEYTERPKSGFKKFTRKIQTQADQMYIHSQTKKLQFSRTCKSKFFSQTEKQKVKNGFFKRPKTCGNQVGRINSVNESLCKQMLW